MKIKRTLLQSALGDVGANAEIVGFQLGDEEYVTILTFARPEEAPRFAVSLALRLLETETPVDIRDGFATIEMSSMRSRTLIRLRGWQLED